MVAPLHELLRKDTRWHWGKEQMQAFQKSKDFLKSSGLLVHYDGQKKLTLACDASQYGLGAVLSHRMDDGSEHPIAYASRTLIKIEDEVVKISLFADDMTCFLRNKSSYENLIVNLDLFSRFSSLKLNEEKTEFFCLGVQNLSKSLSYEHSIKILGVHFDYDELSRKKANFEAIIKSIKKTLGMWKWRGLTLIGKIQIVKSFAIPKFMSKASLIHVSKDLIQAVNKELYSFIWKAKDKVKRLALINNIENGGLKMLDIESMVLAQRTMCLKKYIEDYVSPWKIFLNHYLKKLGGKFILQCHFDCQKLPIFLPEFYKDCLAAWSTLSSKEVCTRML